jgi:glycosyltransferase involved in cell wall biosynthesis
MNTDNNNPKVSVVMSVYNEPEQWLKQAIDSILSQTFGDFEFIIINDNPQRVINRELLQNYCNLDSRIIILENSTNIGLTKSLNIGLLKAKGSYIARMDADDVSLPTRFAKQVDFMDANPNCIACGSWMTYFNDSGLMDLVKEPTESEEIKTTLLLRNCIAHPTVFLRRKVLEFHSIFYNEQVRYCQDYDLFSRLANHGELANLPEPLLNYRRSDQQISTSKSHEQRALGYNIGFNYFISVLRSYGLKKEDKNLLSKIKSLDVDDLKNRHLLSAYYSNLALFGSLTRPLINGDVLKMKDLYLSSVKRAYFRSSTAV